MAKETLIRFVDDLDGTPIEGDATVTFALQGRSFEIDLTPANTEQLRRVLEPFISAARPAKTSRTGANERGARASRRDTRDIRSWATSNGFKISERGRIPADVMAAYTSATGA